MSVINTMLRRLDDRGVDGASLGPTVAPRMAPAPTSRWRLAILMAAGASAVAVAATADLSAAEAWLGKGAHAPRPPAMLVPTTTAAEPPAAPPTIVAVTPSPPSPSATPMLDPVHPPQSAPAPPSTTTLPTVSSSMPAAIPLASIAPPMPARIERRSVEPTAASRAASLQRRAIEAWRSGHAKAALAAAHEALTLDPAHVSTRTLAATLELEAGNPDRAETLLRSGLERAPMDRSLAFLLARTQASGGEVGGALATLEHWRLDDAPASGLRAALLARAGRWPEAQAAYESTARLEPSNGLWWFGLGVVLDAQSDTLRAREAYERARSIGLSSPDQADYAEQRLRAMP